MQFRDKLFQLRKKSGMTQAELAEALNVSRQAISKWEMGTTVPDINNICSISKIFHVSIDYLVNDELDIVEGVFSAKETSDITETNPVNDELDIEEDSSTIKATFKISQKNIWIRIIAIACIVISCWIVGVIAHIPTTVMLFLFIIGFIALIYCGIKLLILFFSKKEK